MQQNFYLKKFAAKILFGAAAFFNAANFICITEFYLMQQNLFSMQQNLFSMQQILFAVEICIARRIFI